MRPEISAYQHLTVCIAEGLRTLGYGTYGNRDYWPMKDGFLIRHNPQVAPSDCAAVVVSDPYVEAGGALPEAIAAKKRSFRTVFLDAQDGSRLFSYDHAYRAFDAILRTHYVDDASNGANFIPWAFGISERMLASVMPLEASERERAILMNFRHQSRPHSVRLFVAKRIEPRIRRVLPIDASIDASTDGLDDSHFAFWQNTGRRHNPFYYARLGRSLACAAFGGYFVSPFPGATASPLARTLKRAIGRAGIATRRIVQWDSWRFWEALASGTAALQSDLAHYRCSLPEMPVPGRHYVGMDLSRPNAALELLADPKRMAEIGAGGRAWALEHYAPEPTARRFLRTIGL